jgi:hypothetical protein
MFIHFSVILSAAKDLIAACNRHEILRCAQDDNSAHPQPATNVAAINVFSSPEMNCANCANCANPPDVPPLSRSDPCA